MSKRLLTRAQALDAAAQVIAKQVADLHQLIGLLHDAGVGRLATALQQQTRPASVINNGSPKPDAALWARGRL